MKEFKLTVKAPWYTRGIWYFSTYGKALSEKQKWEDQGYICTIEEVKT